MLTLTARSIPHTISRTYSTRLLGEIADFQIVVRDGKAVELRLVTPEADWKNVHAKVHAQFPSLPVRRIRADELVFVGVRGKFSYLLREAS